MTSPRPSRSGHAQTVLPRWRGFNLPYLMSPSRAEDFVESDFQWIADFGFDFVRIPMSYRVWVDPDDPFAIREDQVTRVDAAVRFGERHGLHVDLNFHRAPGYCCFPRQEDPWSLWKDEDGLRAFCFHWEYFARRYRGIPSTQLSFNLLNEAPPPADSPLAQHLPMQEMTRVEHEHVMRTATAAIRAIDPERLIIVDGMWYGRGEPTFELADLGVAQSTRAYTPMGLSHYQAPWWREGSMDFPEPTWPGAMEADRVAWDRRSLEEHYGKWAELASLGVGVHCGEGGCWIKTPHRVYLAWFEDVLDILTGHNIGYALWNFRGEFGILDSGRADVRYEEFHGHSLDRELLTLLQKY